MRGIDKLARMLACLSLWGCDGLPAERDPAPDAQVSGEDVVATVGTRAISSSEVRARVARDGVDPKSALDALIEEQLLIEGSLARGLSVDPEAARQVDRMMVRAFLRDLERENDPEDVPLPEVRADFEENQEAYQRLERRDSWHILVKQDSTEAEALASAIVEELERAETPKDVFERYRDPSALGVELPLVVEDLPPITTKAGMDSAYKNALFQAKALGPLKSPVKTAYGWHAIVLTGIEPAERRSLRDVEADIRTRLSDKKRLERLVEVIEQLNAEELVTREEPAIERLMVAKEVPQRAQ